MILTRTLLSGLLMVSVSCVAAAQQTSVTLPAAISDANTDAFVTKLLSTMSVEGKIGQLEQAADLKQDATGLVKGTDDSEELARSGKAGSFLFVTDPVRINKLQRLAVTQSSHDIPLLFGYDVIHGFRTVSPNNLALASSWDPAMVEQVQTMAAREARASGIHWAFSPMVDIARDLRWGRIMEGAGEDPYLGEQMAAAQVRGFQGPSNSITWYPGTEGGNAVANLLTGAAVPSGHLPVTWPRSVGQIPLFYSANLTQVPEAAATRYWDAPSSPLYPFGFGLSYTTFTMDGLTVPANVAKAATLHAAVAVHNTGGVAADQVVQAYTHQRAGSAARPVRELKAFAKVHLAAGETKNVTLEIPASALSYWSPATHAWVLEDGVFDLWVGDSAVGGQHVTFTLTA